MTALTRERIDAEGWLGGHRADVLELLARAERAELRVETLVGAVMPLGDLAHAVMAQHDEETTGSTALDNLLNAVVATVFPGNRFGIGAPEPQLGVVPAALPEVELVSRALVESAHSALIDRDITIHDAVARATVLLAEALGK